MTETMTSTALLNWFEIPVADFNRAKKFYEVLLNLKINEEITGGLHMGVFLQNENEAAQTGGAIIQNEFCVPSDKGTTVYFNGGDDLQPMLDRGVKLGARVIMPKTLINEKVGYMAHLLDSEGNHIALHSIH